MASQKTEEIIEMVADHMRRADESIAIAESIIDLKDRELRRKDEYIKRQQRLFGINLCVTIFSVVFGLVCLGYAVWV